MDSLIKKIKKITKIVFNKLGFEIKRKVPELTFAKYKNLDKANSNNYFERFREIISDPINLLINRVPQSGFLDENNKVFLHNGISVDVNGEFSYYDNFSEILILNRGVHEPLEEYCFQQMLEAISSEKNKAPIMLELGSYWAHYSMWLKLKMPKSKCFMVEPDPIRIKSGKKNFADNFFEGTFINQFVSEDFFKVDKFMIDYDFKTLDILHSDIQGYEEEMLLGSSASLLENKIKYIFISTHSEELHNKCIKILSKFNYRIEVSSDHETHTTSCDGLIFASNKILKPVFNDFYPLGRLDILNSTPARLIKFLNDRQIPSA
jgi:hypothetical protein